MFGRAFEKVTEFSEEVRRESQVDRMIPRLCLVRFFDWPDQPFATQLRRGRGLEVFTPTALRRFITTATWSHERRRPRRLPNPELITSQVNINISPGIAMASDSLPCLSKATSTIVST